MLDRSYGVFDLETTTKTYLGRKASFLVNRVVAWSFKDSEDQYYDYHPFNCPKEELLDLISSCKVLIGHNIKFDLLYLWGEEKLQNWIKAGGMIWDTMLAEYMITGHEAKYPSLRDIAVNKYGCKSRIKHMESFWDRGKDTYQIPKKYVIEDVIEDVKDAEAIYLQQLRKARQLGLEKLILENGNALLATTEMEYNGFQVDISTLLVNRERLKAKILEIEQQTIKECLKYWPENTEEFNVDSPTQLSKIYFGGNIKYKEKVSIGTIKTGVNKGKPKYKNEDRVIYIKGLGIEPKEDWATAIEGRYSTNEKTLTLIKNSPKSPKEAIYLAECILELRGLRKELSTYYDKTVLSLSHDFKVHCEYGHVGTDTGRLNCSSPNLQNQPKAPSLVMKHFTSRFKDGKIVSADYKQIEVVVQAEETGDEKLKQDVADGIDMHSKRLAIKTKQDYNTVLELIKEDYWKAQRSKVKGFSFQLAYGAGKYAIAANTGLAVEEVEELLKQEAMMYPEVASWKKDTIEAVLKNRIYRGRLGRFWKFGSELEEWQLKTQAINYPIQGTAFDVAAIMTGKFFREKAIYNRDKYLMINMIHDSVQLDCKKEWIEQARMDLKVLEGWKCYCQQTFGYKWEMEVRIDISMGDTWHDC